LGLNIRFKGYVYPNIYTQLGSGMEWFYYNFAAGHFHKNKLFSKLYSIEL